MPNAAQLELLTDLLEYYFNIIRSYNAMDMNSKVTYLRYTRQYKEKDYLNVLNTLYEPKKAEEQDNANLEFIFALKTVNELYFNTMIKKNNYTMISTLDFYFGLLGEVKSEHFISLIQKTVDNHINVLIEESEMREESRKDLKRKRERPDEDNNSPKKPRNESASSEWQALGISTADRKVKHSKKGFFYSAPVRKPFPQLSWPYRKAWISLIGNPIKRFSIEKAQAELTGLDSEQLQTLAVIVAKIGSFSNIGQILKERSKEELPVFAALVANNYHSLSVSEALEEVKELNPIALFICRRIAKHFGAFTGMAKVLVDWSDSTLSENREHAINEFDSKYLPTLQAFIANPHYSINITQALSEIKELTQWQLGIGVQIANSVGAFEGIGRIAQEWGEVSFTSEHQNALRALMNNSQSIERDRMEIDIDEMLMSPMGDLSVREASIKLTVPEALNEIRHLNKYQLQTITKIAKNEKYFTGAGDILRAWNGPEEFNWYHAKILEKLVLEYKLPVSEALKEIQGLSKEPLIMLSTIQYEQGVGEALRHWDRNKNFTEAHAMAIKRLSRDQSIGVNEAIKVINGLNEAQASVCMRFKVRRDFTKIADILRNWSGPGEFSDAHADTFVFLIENEHFQRNAEEAIHELSGLNKKQAEMLKDIYRHLGKHVPGLARIIADKNLNTLGQSTALNVLLSNTSLSVEEAAVEIRELNEAQLKLFWEIQEIPWYSLSGLGDALRSWQGPEFTWIHAQAFLALLSGSDLTFSEAMTNIMDLSEQAAYDIFKEQMQVLKGDSQKHYGFYPSSIQQIHKTLKAMVTNTNCLSLADAKKEIQRLDENQLRMLENIAKKFTVSTGAGNICQKFKSDAQCTALYAMIQTSGSLSLEEAWAEISGLTEEQLKLFTRVVNGPATVQNLGTMLQVLPKLFQDSRRNMTLEDEKELKEILVKNPDALYALSEMRGLDYQCLKEFSERCKQNPWSDQTAFEAWEEMTQSPYKTLN